MEDQIDRIQIQGTPNYQAKIRAEAKNLISVYFPTENS